MSLLARLHRRTVILLGSSRSGTTWLSEAINYEHSYRYIFEPTRNKFTLASCPFNDIAPIPTTRNEVRNKSYFDSILAGKIHNYWTDTWSPIRHSRKRLIKEIRVNLMLDWFDHTYPQAKLIFVIRNPFAVTASRSRTDDGWEDHFKRLRRAIQNKALFNDSQMAFINSQSLSRYEQYFAAWCIENLVPLRMLSPDHHVHTVFYEDLQLHPETTFRALFDFLGERIKPRLWQQIGLPSKTSSTRRGKVRPRYVKNWPRELPPSEVKKLRRAAKLFGIDRLYPDGFLPDKQTFAALTSRQHL